MAVRYPVCIQHTYTGTIASDRVGTYQVQLYGVGLCGYKLYYRLWAIVTCYKLGPRRMSGYQKAYTLPVVTVQRRWMPW